MAQQQFFTYKSGVPLTGGETLGFETGKGYYAKPSAGGGGGGGGGGGMGFGLRPGDMSLAKYLASLFGPTQTPQQIENEASQSVQSQVNPILAQLSADAQARMKAGSDAISGLTDTYSKRLAALEPQVHAHDQEAQGNEQAAGGALRDFLASEGNTLAGGVQGAGAGAPAGSAMANAAANAGAGVAGLGAGTAGESAARGYTGLSDLIASGQHAEDYASELPGLAGLAGEQGLGNLTSNVEGDYQGKSNALTAQIPGLVQQIIQQLTSDANTTRGNKASLLQQFLSGALDRNAQKAITDETLGKDYTLATNANTTRTDIANLNAKTKTGLANTKAAEPDPSLSKVYGYVVDAHGNMIPGSDGKKQPVAGKPPKSLTPNEQQRITSLASNIATVAYNGGKAKDGSPLKPLSYNDALTEMRNEGLLTNPASAKIAIAVLKRIYKVNSPASDQIDAMTAHGLSPSGGPALSPKATQAIDNALPLPFGG